MRAARLGLLVLIAMAATPQGADAQTAVERFELFNDCRPICLIVEGLRPDVAGIGLTRERVQNAVESRLRAARLYTSERGSAMLYVSITAGREVFSLAPRYNKLVLDIASGEANLAPTSSRGSTGTHGRDADYIVSQLSGHLDEVLTQYLSVNEAACEP